MSLAKHTGDIRMNQLHEVRLGCFVPVEYMLLKNNNILHNKAYLNWNVICAECSGTEKLFIVIKVL